MRHIRLNKYHIIWLFVLFDLPTNTKRERRLASNFRRDLQRDGFTMHQFSVYNRHCASFQSAQVHIKRVRELIPEKGRVSVIQVTDKQFGDILHFWGRKEVPSQKAPQQLELF